MVNVRIGSHRFRGGAMDDSQAGRPGRPRADDRAARPHADDRLSHLITELQGRGLRVEVPLESRQGGAGPADAGMLWVDGFAATVPTGAHYARTSPYVLRAEDDGWAVYRDGERLASAEPSRRPRYYERSESTRLNSSHSQISYAVFCLKKKNNNNRS